VPPLYSSSNAAVPQAAAKPGTRFVARQPIFTGDERVFGYELLFRAGTEDYFQASDADAASRSTVSTSMLIGLDVLCEGQRAFVNCTREVLLKDYITLLPSTLTVVEVLESVPPDDLVMAACQRLKAAGYLIALDDFAANDPREPLTALADIIKVDLRVTTLEQAAEMVRRHGPWHCRMLAEKVETREEFAAAKKAGFVYFQGYFFHRPETVKAREIPENRINYLRIWQAISRPKLDVREIEELIKREASLCYRLLRYLNSPVFGFGNEIHSVRHALALLGEREVCRWVRLVATLNAGQDKPSELVTSALIRARFCELLSPRVNHAGSDLFLVGLLSLMDAILEIPMTKILEHVALDKESKAVLLGTASPLRPFYRLMLAQESGEWEEVKALCQQLNLAENEVAQSYLQAIQWTHQINAG
jgi:EAL and modified HD-GYP domain-containing signal transduction protein